MLKAKHKTCVIASCGSDSRTIDKDVCNEILFHPFPQPFRDVAKCRRWLRVCRKLNFGMAQISRYTYVCSLHFVGGRGPTEIYPDPVAGMPAFNHKRQLSNKRKLSTDSEDNNSRPPTSKTYGSLKHRKSVENVTVRK